MYDGECYEYKTYDGRWSLCDVGVISYDNYCYDTYCLYYSHLGSCQMYKEYVGSSGTCSGVKSSGYCYSTSCPGYMHDGECYKHRKYVGHYGECSGVKASDGYCYYNDVAEPNTNDDDDDDDTEYYYDYDEY